MKPGGSEPRRVNAGVSGVLTVVYGMAAVLAALQAYEFFFWSEGRQVMPVAVCGAVATVCTWRVVHGLRLLSTKGTKVETKDRANL
jgi:predicted anti-sigma-YlaC factor YlaD